MIFANVLAILIEQEMLPMARKSCTSSPDLFTSFLAAPPKSEVLERLGTLIDWERLRGVMDPAYKLGGVGRKIGRASCRERVYI